MDNLRYARYTFADFTGYLLAPGEVRHQFLAVRHSVAVPPWSDIDIHIHNESEEFFLLLRGELVFLVADCLISLRPMEILMVQPGVPRAIVHGSGLIEHFGFRAPAVEDRCGIGPLTTNLPQLKDDAPRELKSEWGCRVPLYEPKNKNCWLIGYGAAKYPSSHLILAYLDFPSHDEANAGLGTRHRVHHHQESWEYYVVLEGAKTLQIEDQEVAVSPGEILEVSPGVRHSILGRQAPYVGFTLRVPVRDDKVEF